MIIAAREGRPRKTDAEQEDVPVPGGSKVLVMQSTVKLVKKA